MTNQKPTLLSTPAIFVVCGSEKGFDDQDSASPSYNTVGAYDADE